MSAIKMGLLKKNNQNYCGIFYFYFFFYFFNNYKTNKTYITYNTTPNY